jgi:poly(A) polymerase
MTNKTVAIKIVRKLRENGCQALLAGGCVRDMLLKRPAKDYDVATDAKPVQIVKLFKRTLQVGARFGVVIVLVENQQVEVATFRTDAGYTDGRHPTDVKFTTAQEDASRRDFTINGMFYDPLQKKVIDYVGGRIDLKKHLIRTIGNPDNRFSEDYLRMLRAIRFSTQLNFKIEPQTFSAICSQAENITKISAERVAAELEGIFISPNRAAGTMMLIETGLLQIIFTGFENEQSDFAVKVLKFLPGKINFALALAGLFAACETKLALEKCDTLKLSRNQDKHIKFLLSNRGKLLDKKMTLAQLKMVLAEPYFEDLYRLQKAIQKAKKETLAALTLLRKRINALGDMELKPKPLLNGHELIQLGATAGPALGQLARQMYIAQLEGTLQTKQQAIHWMQKWIQKKTKF